MEAEAEDTTLPTFAGRLRAQFLYRGDGSSGDSDGDGDGRVPEDNRKLTSRVPAARSGKRRIKEEEEETDVTDKRLPSASPSPSKRARKPSSSSRYAPPSTYAHLPQVLPDALAPNLLVLFVGLNPGLATARCGHAFAHPTNLFWRLLHTAGLTPVLCPADADQSLPARFRLGLTNIVGRPSRNGAELRPAELDAGVAALEAKARRWRPAAVCLVGKGIWDSVVRVRYGRGRAAAAAAGAAGAPAFHYGWQHERENFGLLPAAAHDDDADIDPDPNWKGARLFVATSTSGLAASLPRAEKEAIWRQLGDWVQQQRQKEAEQMAGSRPL